MESQVRTSGNLEGGEIGNHVNDCELIHSFSLPCSAGCGQVVL
jgi:hypothetical protein